MTTSLAITVFAVAALAITFVGTRLTTLTDRLADRTGLGEAFVGAVFLGAVTSLPGITASVVAAWGGRPEMALSNAIGGIASQTAFLALADNAYRKANLEHAAASVPNMMQAALLVVLLSLLITAMCTPDVSYFSIHPVTPGVVRGLFLRDADGAAGARGADVATAKRVPDASGYPGRGRNPVPG